MDLHLGGQRARVGFPQHHSLDPHLSVRPSPATWREERHIRVGWWSVGFLIGVGVPWYLVVSFLRVWRIDCGKSSKFLGEYGGIDGRIIRWWFTWLELLQRTMVHPFELVFAIC